MNKPWTHDLLMLLRKFPENQHHQIQRGKTTVHPSATLRRVIGGQPPVYGQFRFSSSLNFQTVAGNQSTSRKTHTDMGRPFRPHADCVPNFFPQSDFCSSHSLRWPLSSTCSSLSDGHHRRRQNADSPSLRRGLEGRQSRGLRVILAFLLHPEVRALPGTLVDPRKLTHKPETFLPVSSQLKLYVLV